EHAAVGRREGVRGVVHSKHLARFLGNLVPKSAFKTGVLRLKLPNASLRILGAVEEPPTVAIAFLKASLGKSIATVGGSSTAPRMRRSPQRSLSTSLRRASAFSARLFAS